MAKPIDNGGWAKHMSIRDYLAGQALVGWLACYDDHGEGLGSMDLMRIAKITYLVADAMLAARKGVTEG